MRSRADRAHGRAVTRCLVLLVALGSLLLGTAGVATAALPTADEPAEPSIRVLVSEVSPTVLRPGQDLTVRVLVTNDGPTTVTEPRVTLHLDRESTFISRSSLDRWRTAGPDDWAGAPVVDVDLPAPLPPGETRTVRIDLPSSSVGLGSQWEAWGPRAMAVTAVDLADPARSRLGIARTFALWFTPDEVTPTQVSVVAPLVSGPFDPLDPQALADLDELTGPGGRLARVLAATADREVTWLVDPRLVDPAVIDPATTDPAGTGGDEADGEGADDGDAQGDEDGQDDGAQDAGSLTREWAARLAAATVGRDVQLLPYGDADVAALAHAGRGGVLGLALTRSAQAATAGGLPEGSASAVALPATDLPDLTTAALAVSVDDQALLVGPGQMLPPEVLTFTPTGRTTVSTSAGPVTVLVPDLRLSTALRTGSLLLDTEPDPVAERPEGEVPRLGTSVTAATAAQDLLAELAVITRERPSDGRHLLISLPRDWNPTPQVASAQLAALEQAPWVRTEPLSALVGAPDPRVDRGSLPAGVVEDGEITRSQIDRLEEALTTRAELAAMAEQPELLMGEPDSERLAAVSVAWRTRPEGRDALIDRSRALTAELRDAVTVEPGSTVNLISTTGEVPVQVSNSLDQPVTVQVALRPGDARLRVDEVPTVTIPAGGRETVQIPVHAIQSADLRLPVELQTVDGTVVNSGRLLTVRVRAEWEGIGTAVIGALLAIGLVVGVFRTIRRGRTPRRADPVIAGPDALSPEEVAEDAGEALEVEAMRTTSEPAP